MCNKICYSKKEAQSALNQVKHSRFRDKHRRECRYYYCKVCNAWHLTSHEDTETLNIPIKFVKKWKKMLKY